MSTQPPKPIRSPSYPNMSLSEAVSGVRKIESVYRLSKVDRVAAAKLIGYSTLSGPANKALAALAQYGLVERAGKGDMRVTARAQAILHPNSEDERRTSLRMAALEPQLFRELQERFPNITPPQDDLTRYLNRQGFNQTAIRPAAKAYLETLLFLEEAGATESHGGSSSEERESQVPPAERANPEIVYGGARVGDLIDYESGGAIANPTPMRVRAISDDGAWVFVDDSVTGLEMAQVIVKERPEGSEAKADRPTLPIPKDRSEDEPPKPGSRKAVFPISDGDVTLTFPEDISNAGLKRLKRYLEIFLDEQIEVGEGQKSN